LLFGKTAPDASLSDTLNQQLKTWAALGQTVAKQLVSQTPALKDAEPVALALTNTAVLGQDLLAAWTSHQTRSADWVKEQLDALQRLDQRGPAAVVLPIIPSLKLLVVSVGDQDKHSTLSPEARRALVRQIAFPPKEPSGH